MTLMRDMLRQMTVAALKAADTDAGDNIFSPGDWPSDSDAMPALLISCKRERKESMTRAQPNFTTTAYIRVDARLEDTNEGDAQDSMNALCDQVEQAILTNHDIIEQLQQISSVETQMDIVSEGGKHVAQAVIEFGMEFYQSQEDYYAPVNPPQLNEITVQADLTNHFDPSGTYPDPAFPDSVKPAPRTSGPDGRNEGAIDIALPT
jgi:hypothetical protein